MKERATRTDTLQKSLNDGAREMPMSLIDEPNRGALPPVNSNFGDNRGHLVILASIVICSEVAPSDDPARRLSR
jgi:hypothetical protein